MHRDLSAVRMCVQIHVKMAWFGVAVAVLAAAWACTIPAPEVERAAAPLPTLEATPEWAPAFPPRTLYVVDRTESSLAVVWNSINRATHYDVQRSDSADGEYAILATEVAALGLADEGLKPDSVYYYLVRGCNHLGCTEFSVDPVAGVTESDADCGYSSGTPGRSSRQEEDRDFP